MRCSDMMSNFGSHTNRFDFMHYGLLSAYLLRQFVLWSVLVRVGVTGLVPWKFIIVDFLFVVKSAGWENGV